MSNTREQTTAEISPEVQAQLDDRAPSMGEMLRRRIASDPQRTAFLYPDAQENWQPLTWQQAGEIIYDLAAGLLAVGLEPEGRVALASTTRVEWILADLAVMCAGGATTTVYPTTKHDDVSYIMGDSGSRVAIVEDTEQLEKLAQNQDVYTNLLAVVLIDGDSSDDKVHSWQEFRELGQAYRNQNPDAVERAIAGTGPDTLSTLIYTSGTTGRPKGVRLTHDAWCYLGRSVQLFDLATYDDLQYLWLPLSHVFGKALIAIQVQIGFQTAVDGRIDKIVDGLGTIKPTFMCGAPRIFEKVRAKVMMGTATGLKAKIARWAFQVGKKTIPYRLENRPLPRGLATQYALADKLVFSKLKERLGGNLRFMISGSAKLNSQVQQWFYAAGILIVEGYGMTESSAVTCVNDPRLPKLGTVGTPIPGTRLKIAEDGEVLIAGPAVMRGYHNLPEQTAETLTPDGWLRTGDIGEIDEGDRLKITDRKKDLIKTSGGKYVAPQKVEGALVANCPYISQVIVHGENRKYISALISLDPEALEGWAQSQDDSRLKGMGYAELVRSPEVEKMISGYVDQGNARLERWETVKRFRILDQELTVDEGAVTPSLKIRRGAVENKYADWFDSMYDKED
ncbi:AMP-dependent synthetase/ligase [Enemella evansiae]|uniref:Acyl-CoA synthetase n=1 Tax=Enemella evansiae TaxID=2016499 RepID=A0A255G3D1_9ACTN|nr:long-chain fatty acid--CoA ligase [Enemella evansiae]OYO04480.1 long-chain fatty acid--CoA ligase [Enemella evansiae]OYO06256.1 long-chain fatty acid--CoA ligase [Enemella evansiae]OYO08713.1 long-chain fatty acid--CoA ligase [Enemella evansiae]TDO87994.1 long-chain acyl-CoA synthetase [Enemella evansiae]